MGAIADLYRGNGLQKKDFTDNGVGCIHYGQIYTRYGTFAAKTISFVDEDLAAKLLKVRPNDLIVTATSENLEDVCKTVAWLGDTDVVTGGHSIVVRHRQNAKYLAYYFQTRDFFQAKRAYMQGIKVMEVKKDDLARSSFQFLCCRCRIGCWAIGIHSMVKTRRSFSKYEDMTSVISNSSSLSLLTVLKPGGSSHIGTEPKPAKTIDQMIDLMTERGLTITDEAQLRRALFDCNYYRLSGYFRPFQINPVAGDNRYRLGTRDVDFLIPYEMDEELRNIILKGTAKVELALRSRFAYLLASDGGAYMYMDPESYQAVRNKRGELLRDNLLRNMGKWMGMSNEVCMRHYQRSGRPVPVWAAVETFPFDTLSRMISLHTDAKALRELYRSVGLRTNLRTSSEVVHAMVYLRNLCSHHARLWHREMVIPSPMTRDMKAAFPDFAYGEKSTASSLLALMYLVNHIEGGGEYSAEIRRFLDVDGEYATGIATALHWE